MGGQLELSADVRIRDTIREYVGQPRPSRNGRPGKPYTSYTVRWTVAGNEFTETFATRTLAVTRQSRLLTYHREGVLFDVHTGLPEPEARAAYSVDWYTHCIEYVDMKWPGLAPKSRYSMAESLSRATTALLKGKRGRPKPEVMRRALEHYAFNASARQAGPPPPDLAPAIDWLKQNTIALSEFGNLTASAALTRAAISACSTLLDGRTAAANTIARRRAIVYGCFDYGVECGRLTANPLEQVSIAKTDVVDVVDRRLVIDQDTLRQFLKEVGRAGTRGPRLVAFFAMQGYAALRPSEALYLIRDCFISLPDEGWGEGILYETLPVSGRAWTDSGQSREPRGLKHRPRKAIRPFPIHPELVKIIRWHIAVFKIGPGERMFRGPRGGMLAPWAYLETFHRARAATLTAQQAKTIILQNPYALRHTCVSIWLNASVDATQVAEWAGHGVGVLLRVYAQCVLGGDQIARNRISAATQTDPNVLEGEFWTTESDQSGS